MRLLPLLLPSRGALPYALLSLLLFALNIGFMVRQVWAEDFWVYLALLDRIAENPLDPNDPFLETSRGNIRYWPYLAPLALVTRLTGISAPYLFSACGAVNLLFLLVLFRRFSLSLLDYREEAAVLALLFMLVLWGDSPWDFGGFFHFDILFFVTPYPSTFAVPLAFTALASYRAVQGSRDRIAPVVSGSVIATLVLLMHPLTFIVLAAALIAETIASIPRLRRPEALGALLVVPLGAALAWPYFPLANLVGQSAAVEDPGARALYQEIFSRIYPALFGVPFLAFRLRGNPKDRLAWWCAILVAIYLYGGFFGKWNYGRMISFVVMALQIALAGGVADGLRSERPIVRKGAVAITALAAITLLTKSTLTFAALASHKPEMGTSYERFRFLERYAEGRPVILSDLKTSIHIPAMGGRAVLVDRPGHYGGEYEPRLADIKRFFGDGASDEERRRIIGRYHAQYLLLDTTRYGSESLASLRRVGRVVHAERGVELLAIREGEQPRIRTPRREGGKSRSATRT